MFLGVLLLGIGVVALAVQLGILPVEISALVWPMLAIFVGVWLLMNRRHGPSCTCWGCDMFNAPRKGGK